MNVFSTYYYPVFRSKCASCHENGPGLGYFANSNFATAFDAFQSLGRARVERNFLNPNHQAGLTGTQNLALVNSTTEQWLTAEEKYSECAKDSGQLSEVALTTLHRSNNNITAGLPQTNPWIRLQWDLETDTSSAAEKGLYLMIATIEVRVALINGVARGYEFRNPTLRLKPNATKGYRFENISVSVNNSIAKDVTTYNQISGILLSTTDINLAPGASQALAIFSTVSRSDTFALVFEKIEIGDFGTIGSGGGSGGGTTVPPPLPTRVTYAQLTSTDPTLNVLSRACLNCHNAANLRGGLDLSKHSIASSAVNLMLTRINDPLAPMPPSAMLNERDRELIRIWQTSGTPQ